MKALPNDYLKRGLAMVIMVVLGWLSFTVSDKGFHQIEKLRQLERLPPISIASILTGETQPHPNSQSLLFLSKGKAL